MPLQKYLDRVDPKNSAKKGEKPYSPSCAKAISDALIAGGMDESKRPANAQAYIGVLQSDTDNFKELEGQELKDFQEAPQNGDIVVFKGGFTYRKDGKDVQELNGHIAMYDEKEKTWTSDFKQTGGSGMYGGSKYRGRGYMVFRFKGDSDQTTAKSREADPAPQTTTFSHSMLKPARFHVADSQDHLHRPIS